MERQNSASSSISLNSWGSDLAEDREDYHGFNFSTTSTSQDSTQLLLQPEVLCRERPCTYPPCSTSDSFELLLSRRFPMAQNDKEYSTLILMMKERFAKLLLGEDYSGGSKGSNTALTISNAITKLSVAIFGDLWRLEPLSQENKVKWKREMEWLVSPCDYIVELVPTSQSLHDGSTVEVMASKPRSDVYIGLPALQKLDGMLLEVLESFSETEFWYAESVQETPSGCNYTDCKMWIPVAKVPSCGLSEKARRQLSNQRENANQILKAAKSINEHVLAEMEIPESYWKTLPKSGKKVMADTPLRIITSEYCCFETLLSTLEYPSYRSLSNLANSLESLIHVWNIKIKNKLLKHAPHPEDMACRATPSWSMTKDTSLKKVEKKKKYVERAQSLLSELRQRFPGLLQTALELSKIQHNRDVGYAVLESYSRVLVNLSARIQTRIGEVIAADKDAVLSRLQSLNGNTDSGKMVAEEGPLTSPGANSVEPQDHGSSRRLSTDSLTYNSKPVGRAWHSSIKTKESNPLNHGQD